MNSKPFKFISALERSLKILVILFCFSSVFIAWVHFSGHNYNNETTKAYQVIAKGSKNLKYILFWTRADFAPFYYYGKGQTAFIKNNCSHVNCFVTSNRKLFNSKMTKFDAILFNGRNLDSFDLPKVRSPNQMYIYMMTESADNYPVCDPVFNNFFNWTATYRLDSDIPMTYMVIRNMSGEIVGPKMKMEWVSLDSQNVSLNEKFYTRMQMKRKTVAWFASKCSTLGGRETAVNRLQKALSSYGLTIDIYGACGDLYCRKNDVSCDEILRRDYLFYLAFENSLAVDYVTEKVVRALQNDVVPIVYGKADYSR
ncbi:alpha-(1,3)-fucosyltransferase C-like [Hyposmocoma kahamanoa]|uniref:alpha-(1,3)-fucosyltransferase C-like n=1 Tax=Hyposmocoma kahamanoa TaxID=1477025 RepID=UPI000E6D791B|nr:alpha-(1,3)-fucosyltransferase C-like [Hyposmocoma kahamanoa]